MAARHWRGNKLADELADGAAEQHAVPKAVRDHVLLVRHQAAELHVWQVAVLRDLAAAEAPGDRGHGADEESTDAGAPFGYPDPPLWRRPTRRQQLAFDRVGRLERDARRASRLPSSQTVPVDLQAHSLVRCTDRSWCI